MLSACYIPPAYLPFGASVFKKIIYSYSASNTFQKTQFFLNLKKIF